MRKKVLKLLLSYGVRIRGKKQVKASGLLYNRPVQPAYKIIITGEKQMAVPGRIPECVELRIFSEKYGKWQKRFNRGIFTKLLLVLHYGRILVTINTKVLYIPAI